MKRVNIYIDENDLERVKKSARQEGSTQSVYIRQAIKRALKASEKKGQPTNKDTEK